MNNPLSSLWGNINDKHALSDLAIWHKVMAALYLIQAILILFLAKAHTFPITTNYLAIDTLQTHGAGHAVLVEATSHIFDINLVILIVAALIVAAIAYALIVTAYQPIYEADFKNKLNKARWVENLFTMSVMIIAISLLVGVSSVVVLSSLVLFTVIMNLLGLVIEINGQRAEHTNKLLYVIACISGAIPWIILVVYLVGGAIYGNRVSWNVYGIVTSLFVLSMGFLVNLYLEYRQINKWKNYFFVERVYILLAFITLTAFAWQTFISALR